MTDELLPTAHHVTEQYANNRIEADHGRLKSRLRPMRGLQRLRSPRVISTGHAFIQNLRHGHYQLGGDIDPRHRLADAFTEPSPSDPRTNGSSALPSSRQRRSPPPGLD